MGAFNSAIRELSECGCMSNVLDDNSSALALDRILGSTSARKFVLRTPAGRPQFTVPSWSTRLRALRV